MRTHQQKKLQQKTPYLDSFHAVSLDRCIYKTWYFGLIKRLLLLQKACNLSLITSNIYLHFSRFLVLITWSTSRHLNKHCLKNAVYEKSEAVVRRSSVIKVFLNISQNSQERICARVSFLIKFQASRPATSLKKRPWNRCFPLNFAKFLRTLSLIKHLLFLCLCLKNISLRYKNFQPMLLWKLEGKSIKHVKKFILKKIPENSKENFWSAVACKYVLLNKYGVSLPNFSKFLKNSF